MEKSKDQTKRAAFKMTGNWKDQAKQLKTKYNELTDEDLTFEPGNENDLFKKIETKLHKNRNEVENIIRKVQPVQS